MTRRLLVAYAIGGAFTLFGAYAMFTNGNLGQWKSAAIWFAGGIVGHDFILTPIVLSVGYLVVRFVPGPYRGFAQAALFISAAVTVAAAVLLSGRGLDPNIPSQQPLPYGRNLVVVLALVWIAAAALAVLRYLRAPRATAATALPSSSQH